MPLPFDFWAVLFFIEFIYLAVYYSLLILCLQIEIRLLERINLIIYQSTSVLIMEQKSCEESDREVSRAASILLSMKQAILDPNQARILEDKKRETLCKLQYSSKRAKTLVIVLPEEGYSIDGTKLPERPPEQTIQALIYGDKISPPFEKQITESDTTKNLSRINLNKSIAVEHYIKMLGANVEERLEVGIKVTTYGPDGRGFDMYFKHRSNKYYFLDNGWHDFCKEYKLKPWINWATIWMFIDKHGGICFAITWKTNHSTTERVRVKAKQKTLKI